MIMRIVFRHGHHVDVPVTSFELNANLNGDLIKVVQRWGDDAPVRLRFIRLDDVVAVLAIDEPADGEPTTPEGDTP